MMVKFYPLIPDEIQTWMLEQPIFFVASAPLVGRHVNVSPKGHPSRTLRILGPNKIAYLDATGSGCETISHIYENGRVTVMFNSFGSGPRILRLFCRGQVVEKGSRAWDGWLGLFQEANNNGVQEADEKEGSKGDPNWERQALISGSRAVIILDVFKVQTSCGYGVPIMENPNSARQKTENYWEDRTTMPTWASKKDKTALREYWRINNCESLDGLPGLRAARREKNQWLLLHEVTSWLWRVLVAQGDSLFLGFILTLLMLLAIKAMGSVGFRSLPLSLSS